MSLIRFISPFKVRQKKNNHAGLLRLLRDSSIANQKVCNNFKLHLQKGRKITPKACQIREDTSCLPDQVGVSDLVSRRIKSLNNSRKGRGEEEKDSRDINISRRKNHLNQTSNIQNFDDYEKSLMAINTLTSSKKSLNRKENEKFYGSFIMNKRRSLVERTRFPSRANINERNESVK